jgi:hypothetical protein
MFSSENYGTTPRRRVRPASIKSYFSPFTEQVHEINFAITESARTAQSNPDGNRWTAAICRPKIATKEPGGFIQLEAIEKSINCEPVPL